MLNDDALQKTLDELQKKYNVIGRFIFFSEFQEPDGEKNIFNALNNMRKKYFFPDDQIIFVQDCDDEYEYGTRDESAGKYIGLIQKFLDKVDITNCFVTIVTANPSIKEEILTVNNDYSHSDHTLINFVQIAGKYNKNLNIRDTFCVLAWREIFTKTDGTVLPCCSYERPYDLGNLKNQSLNDILHEKKLKTLRKNMLNGLQSPGCESCYYKEKHGIKSRRQLNNEKSTFSFSTAKKITLKDGGVFDDNICLDSVELALESTCNLKCRCCSGDSSTLIALEEEKLFGFSRNKEKILNNSEKKSIVESVSPYVLRTKSLKFSGGEPTLHKGHYEILNLLLENKKEKDVKLGYSINGTNLYYKNKSIIDLWKKFKSIEVVFSIDGFEKTFEYLRDGAEWEVVKENVLKIKNDCPHINLGVNSVISFLSIESTIKLQRNWYENGIINGDAFYMTLIEGHNSSYDIQALPPKHKRRVGKVIDEHCIWLRNQNQKKLEHRWHEIKNYMNSLDKTHNLSHAKKDIELIDSFRKRNFYAVFPTIADIFNGIDDTQH